MDSQRLMFAHLAISPADHIFAGTFGGVFRSTDNGDHWVAVNNGLEFPFVISLAVDCGVETSFAGTFEGGGVYRSTDDGENWTLVDNGLTNTYVTALAINSAGPHLRRNFWRRRIPFHRQRR